MRSCNRLALLAVLLLVARPTQAATILWSGFVTGSSNALIPVGAPVQASAWVADTPGSMCGADTYDVGGSATFGDVSFTLYGQVHLKWMCVGGVELYGDISHPPDLILTQYGPLTVFEGGQAPFGFMFQVGLGSADMFNTLQVLPWLEPTSLAFGDGSYVEADLRPVVPEPGSLLLLGTGLAGLARWRRRRA